MVFTLHRYIFGELMKVFILAAVALTLILSLGSILRPIAEYGVGPWQVVHLMGYFLPITLTFVLPMAALFAAALVYGRLANDNELDACKASGVSLLTLVYPGLALAIVVAIANLILSFHVMPDFVHRAEKALKADAKQIIFRNIQRRGYYKLPPDGRYRIYADFANSQNDTLSGVIVLELKDYGIEKFITAESATVHFNPHERFNEVRITAYNTYQEASEDEGGFYAEWLSLTTEFGSLMGDSIKFKKVDEMKRIQVDQMRFYPIAKLARETYAQFTAELLAQDIAGRIAGGGGHISSRSAIPNNTNRFYKLYSGEKFIEFTAGQCSVQGEKKVELSGEVVVIEYDLVIESDVVSRQLSRTLRSKRVLLHVEDDEPEPTLTMELYNPRWQSVDGSEGLAHRLIIRGLIVPTGVDITDEFKTNNVLEAIKLASESSVLQKGPSPKLKALQNKLQRKIQRTLVKIKAEIHSRLVFGIGCVPMILIGIGLGIIKKGGHLLAAFAASCAPAGALIVCIIMGKNIAKNPGAQAGSGIGLMWAGLAFLSLLAVVIYRKLLKN